MGKEKETSPSGKPNYHKHSEIREIDTSNIISEPAQISVDDLSLSGENLVEIQSDALGDKRNATSKNSRNETEAHSNPNPILREALDLVQKNPDEQTMDHEQGSSKAHMKSRQSKSWEFGDRYNKKGVSGPDFGPPVLNTHTPRTAKYIAGGPTPLNRLKSSDRDRQKNKHTRPYNSDYSSKSHESRQKRRDPSSRRRQFDSKKFDLSRADLDKVSQFVDSQGIDRIEPPKPGISQDKNHNHPIMELWKVDNIVRIKSKNRHKIGRPSSDEKKPEALRSLKPELKVKPEMKRTSDFNHQCSDSIEDGFVELASSSGTRDISKINETIGDCNETSVLDLLPVKSRIPGSRLMSIESHSTSLHPFSKEKSMAPDTKSNLNSFTNSESSIERINQTCVAKLSTENLDRQLNQDESLDEISIAHYGNVFQNPLSTDSLKNDLRHNKKTNEDKNYEQCVDTESSFEVFQEKREAYRSPVTSISLNMSNRRARANSDVSIFSVLQVFCNSKIWLLPSRESSTDNHRSWSLHLNQIDRSLQFYDEKNESVPGLDLGRVNTIQTSINHGKMLITKPSSAQDTVGSYRICLELRNSNESESFIQSIIMCEPNVDIVYKENYHYFERVFERTLKLVRSAAKRPKLDQSQPFSSFPAQNKSDSVVGRAGASKDPSLTKLEDLSHVHLSAEQIGIAKSMTTRSHQSPADSRIKCLFDVSKSNLSQNSDELCTPGRISLPIETPRIRLRKSHSTNDHMSGSLVREPERWTKSHPTWRKQWHASIVYPAVGKNKATVDLADIDRLDEGEFINDNLMMFYLRWLQHKMEVESPQRAKRIYFHNTFFYERLTNVTKGTTGINYANVERWTSKVNLLEFDYIVVPVNENFHWYVAIICNAPKLVEKSQNLYTELKSNGKTQSIRTNTQKSTDIEARPPLSSPNQSPKLSTDVKADAELRRLHSSNQSREVSDDESDPVLLQNSDVELDSVSSATKHLKKILRSPNNTSLRKLSVSEPRIITLDSFGHSHSLTCTNLKKYLLKEIESKLQIVIDDPGHLGKTAKNIPQQDNFSDCGLFVLGYIEIFLRDPDLFVSDLLQNKFPDDTDWQKPSDMRANIRKLLFKLQSEAIESLREPRQEILKGKRVTRILSPARENTSGTSESSKIDVNNMGNRHPQNLMIPEINKNYKSETHSLPNQENYQSFMDKNDAVLQTENSSFTNVTKEENNHSKNTESKVTIPSNDRPYAKMYRQSLPTKPIHDDELPIEPTKSTPSIEADWNILNDTSVHHNYETSPRQNGKSCVTPPHYIRSCLSPAGSCQNSLTMMSDEDHKVENDEKKDSQYDNPSSPKSVVHCNKYQSMKDSRTVHSKLPLKSTSIESVRPPSSLKNHPTIYTAPKTHELQILPPANPSTLAESNSNDSTDITAAKRRRDFHDKSHQKRHKLSSSSWKRDGIEEAMLKSMSRSTAEHPEKSTFQSNCNNSSIIVIE